MIDFNLDIVPTDEIPTILMYRRVSTQWLCIYDAKSGHSATFHERGVFGVELDGNAYTQRIWVNP